METQGREKAVEPTGDQRSELWFFYHLGRRIRAKLAGSADEADRPVLDLTWDYPTAGKTADPDAKTVDRDGRMPAPICSTARTCIPVISGTVIR